LEGGGSSGITRLINGESRTITCRVDTSTTQEEAFTAPLEIQLDYFYKDSEKILFTVEKSEF